MIRWQQATLALAAACVLAGLILVWTDARFLAWPLYAVALICISANMAWLHLDDRRERAAQAAWEREIASVADDIRLEGYGVTSLAELASYHDAAGRAEVLAALRALPPGERRLVVAARQVDPEGVWD